MADARTIRLLYGRDGMELRVPASAVVLAGQHAPAMARPEEAIADSLRRPVGCDSLADLLRRRNPRTVAVTISDITRPVPNRLILPAILDTLNACGITDEQATVIIGTGMHRPSTPEELEELVGRELLKRVRIVDHRSDDSSTLVRIADDPPVSVNAIFARADFRIVTGLIEPHFMAGFSGGRKGVCPALVDLNTVQRFHGHRILGDERSSNGNLDGNPCHAESLRIARLVGVDFLVNVAINGRRELCGVWAGEMEQAHAAGVAEVTRWTSARVEEPFDLVVTSGGGYPLDQTFYQTVKGMVTALPACHDRSTILIASHCGEGIGSSSYTDVMLSFSDDWRRFLEHIAAAKQVRKDQWNAQMQCRVLAKIGQERLWFASDGLPADVQGRLWVTPLVGQGTAQERCQVAIDEFIARNRGARVAVVPDGPYTMLRLVPSPGIPVGREEERV